MKSKVPRPILSMIQLEMLERKYYRPVIREWVMEVRKQMKLNRQHPAAAPAAPSPNRRATKNGAVAVRDKDGSRS